MPKTKKFELWLQKAHNDIYIAEKISELGDRALDMAIGHTQQCAEKALKAFLVYHKKPVIKTHDLINLLRICAEIDSGFNELVTEAACLNPLSTEFRYPEDEVYLPTNELMQESIRRARRILTFVKARIEKK